MASPSRQEAERATRSAWSPQSKTGRSCNRSMRQSTARWPKATATRDSSGVKDTAEAFAPRGSTRVWRGRWETGSTSIRFRSRKQKYRPVGNTRAGAGNRGCVWAAAVTRLGSTGLLAGRGHIEPLRDPVSHVKDDVAIDGRNGHRVGVLPQIRFELRHQTAGLDSHTPPPRPSKIPITCCPSGWKAARRTEFSACDILRTIRPVVASQSQANFDLPAVVAMCRPSAENASERIFDR